jgi:hypothetical protein
MASYQSNLDQFNAYQAPGDLNLINQTLAINQQKYDVGEQAYEDNLSKLKLQEDLLLRPEDKQRFARNVQGLIDEVNNKEGGINWAKRGLTNKINSYTKQALDDYTLDQIGISQQIKSFNAEVQEKKKKNDGSYSDVNYAYSQNQAGIGDYLKGVDANGNKVDTIGNLQYHNYVDVTESALKKVKAFKDLRGDESVEVPFTDANGVMRTKTTKVNGLSESELLAYVPQILSPEEGKQLQINGWAKFQGDGGLQVAQETFKNYTKDVNANLDENIAKLNIEANNKNISQEQRDKAHADKQTQEDLKRQYSTAFNSIDPNDAASIGGFLETVNWKTNFAKMAGAKPSISYDTDAAAYSAANLELAQREELRKAEKHPYELEKLKQDVSAATTTGAVGVGAGGVSLSTIAPEKVEETQPYVSLVKDFGQQSASIVAIGNTTLAGGGVDDNTKKAYSDSYNDAIKRGYAPATATKIAFDKSGMANLFPEQYADIQEAYIRRGNTATVIQDSDKAIIDTFNSDPNKYLEGVNQQLIRYNKIMNLSRGAHRNAEEEKLVSFVTSNGGIKGIIEKAKGKDGEKVVGQLLKLSGTSDVLEEDALGKRNEIVVKRGQGVVNTAQIATVTNPKLAEQIINAIPQEEGKVPFDSKQGITYKALPSGEFEITQSGTKEGGKGMYGSSRKYTVKPTDDLYKVLSSLTLNEAQRRGVTASNSTTAIKNENIQYLDYNNEDVTTTAGGYIDKTLGKFVMKSGVNPARYLTKETTSDVLKQGLSGIVPTEKIDRLVQLMSTDTYNKFSVIATPQQGQYKITTNLTSGGAPLLLLGSNSNQDVMNKQLLLFIKQYPQISVGEAMLQYLRKHPTEIDTILKRLR